MKLALLGYGKMGQLVEQAALAKGHEVISRFSRQLGSLDSRQTELIQADLAIDFTQSSCVMTHLEICLSMNKPLIIGTTGWESHYQEAQEMVKKRDGSCFYSPNFSIGAYLFQEMAAKAAALFQSFPEYDVCGVEYHHHQKKDAPSGTSKALSKQILAQMPRLDHFHFTSIRSGHYPGTHSIEFDSPIDTITLTHQARNRQGFAHGAILAAEWLLSRKGFFTMEDMMNSLQYPLRDKITCN